MLVSVEAERVTIHSWRHYRPPTCVFSSGENRTRAPCEDAMSGSSVKNERYRRHLCRSALVTPMKVHRRARPWGTYDERCAEIT